MKLEEEDVTDCNAESQRCLQKPIEAPLNLKENKVLSILLYLEI